MADWALDNFGWILVATTIGLLALLWVAVDGCEKEKSSLVAECVQSGKQSFECKAMFQSYCKSGDTGTYVAPVIINSGRGTR